MILPSKLCTLYFTLLSANHLWLSVGKKSRDKHIFLRHSCCETYVNFCILNSIKMWEIDLICRTE